MKTKGAKDKKPRKPYRVRCLYTVYDNRTDELVILDGTSKQCAKALNMTQSSWRATVTRVRKGQVKKWHITMRHPDQEE